jgi:hypothetical protein
MAKAPKPGKVKTRLARCLPPQHVTSLYRCLLDDTLALARSLAGVEVDIMCPAADVHDLTCIAGDSVRVVTQQGEGLAAGLTSVFSYFAASGRKRVIAFDSDSPHLPASVLERAFDALETSDVVVGPTHDGGYYLVGAKASYPELFSGDSLGTANALQALMARAQSQQLSVRFTDPFYDIDEEADLIRLSAELRLAPGKAPKTAAWLAEWEHGRGAR